jgi:tetratricopeptide (TPR) repeat protein
MTTPRRRLTTALAMAVLCACGIAVVAALPHLAGTAPALERLEDAARSRPLGATDVAVSDAQSATEASPEDADALAHLGAALLDQARLNGDPSLYARAETAFEYALEPDGTHPAALVGRGTLALARHEFAEALEIGERARALVPDVVRIDGVIGDALVELGRYDEALEAVQHMVDVRPDLASYSRVAYLRELHGDLDGAIEALELALSAGSPVVEHTEYVRVQLGNLQLAAGRPELAERLYRNSLARLAGYVHATGGLARVAISRGDLDEAVALLTDATVRQPLPELVVLLGETLEADGRLDEARVQYGLAEALQRLYEANGVAVDLELAAFTAEHAEPDAAVELARRAYHERPSVHAADALAWALHRAGDDRGADRHAREAVRLGTADPRILYHAGAIADAIGDGTRARDLLGRALAGNPAFHPLDAPRAAELLARLEAASP